jgi:hypothetical protein
MRKIQKLFCVIAVALILLMLAGHAWADDVSILSSSSFVDDAGRYHIVGEVQNTLQSSISQVDIIAYFYDQNYTTLGMNSTYTLLDIVPPGAKTPFDVVCSGTAVIPQISSYNLIVSYVIPMSEKPAGIRILNSSSHFSQGGDLHVTVDIQNVQTGKATKVEAIATFYASDGTVVDCGFNFIDPPSLMPNQKASFDIIVRNSSRIPQILFYQLTCQSQEYAEAIPEYTSIIAVLLLASSTILGATFWKKRTRARFSQTPHHVEYAFEKPRVV